MHVIEMCFPRYLRCKSNGFFREDEYNDTLVHIKCDIAF